MSATYYVREPVSIQGLAPPHDSPTVPESRPVRAGYIYAIHGGGGHDSSSPHDQAPLGNPRQQKTTGEPGEDAANPVVEG